MILRPYQQEAVESILKEWETNRSTLLVLPTGVGKTVVFAAVIQAIQPRRAMVIAHREELIWQARDKIKTVTGLDSEIEMADLSASPNLFNRATVVISTVQTLNSGKERKRMSRFDPREFGVLIIDEAHHGTADSYQNVVNYFTQHNPDLKVLGVTATPDRTDEEALGQVFQTVAFDYEILDAIHGGWLVPIDQQMVNIHGLDFSHIRTTAGDLNGADLAAVMEEESNMQGVAGASVEIIGKRRAIVFSSSVKQAETLCSIFNRHRPGSAAWVCGSTPKDERRLLLSDFAAGKTQIVCNCGVLTEGFDDPGVEVIVMARPTKSRALYAQCCGRSTRPLPGLVDGLFTDDQRKLAIAQSAKSSCLIVDFVGNSGKHKLMSAADILGGKVSERAIERAKAMAEKLGKPVRMSETLDQAEGDLRAEDEKRRLEQEAQKAKIMARVSYSKQAVNPFDVLDITPVRERGWDNGKTLSEKQRAVLQKQGIDPEKMPYAQSRQLLNEIFRRWNNKQCSYGQAKILKRYQLPTDVSAQEAKSMIDRIASNGWQKPVDMVPENIQENENVPF